MLPIDFNTLDGVNGLLSYLKLKDTPLVQHLTAVVAGTSLVVSHNLGIIPNTIIPLATDGTQAWVTAVTPTQLTVNTAVAGKTVDLTLMYIKDKIR